MLRFARNEPNFHGSLGEGRIKAKLALKPCHNEDETRRVQPGLQEFQIIGPWREPPKLLAGDGLELRNDDGSRRPR